MLVCYNPDYQTTHAISNVSKSCCKGDFEPTKEIHRQPLYYMMYLSRIIVIMTKHRLRPTSTQAGPVDHTLRHREPSGGTGVRTPGGGGASFHTGSEVDDTPARLRSNPDHRHNIWSRCCSPKQPPSSCCSTSYCLSLSLSLRTSSQAGNWRADILGLTTLCGPFKR